MNLKNTGYLPLKKITLFVFTIIFLSSYLIYMFKLHPEVAYMDSLRFLAYFKNSIEGTSSLITTWNQGEHHGLLPQILVFLNAKYFGYKVFLSTLLSGIVLSATAIVIAVEQFRTIGNDSKLTLLGLLFFTYLALFSFANWELYALDVGVTLFIKNFLFILYWIFIDRAMRSSNPSWYLQLGLMISGPIIILLVAFGWSYAFFITAIFCFFWNRTPSYESKKLRKKTLVILLISIFSYIFLGNIFGLSGGSFRPTGIDPSLYNFITAVPFAISSIFIGSESLGRLGLPLSILVCMTILLVAVSSYLIARALFKKAPLPTVPFALMIYASFHAIAVSWARGRYVPEFAAAPRYYTDLSLLIIGVLWAAIVQLNYQKESEKKSSPLLYVTCLIAVIFLIGQLYTNYDEWLKAPYRNAVFMKMKEVTLKGVDTQEEAALLQQPLTSARLAARIQREFNIGPFSELKLTCSAPELLSGSLVGSGNIDWIGKETYFIIKKCSDELELQVYLPESWTSRKLTLSIDGVSYPDININPGLNVVHLNVPQKSNYLNLHLSVSKLTLPIDVNMGSTDSRELGVVIKSISTLSNK